MAGPRIRLDISYDGTDFLGWQKQPDGKTVQGELDKALFKLFQQPVITVGAGRTDSGVHAMGQVAHFDAPKDVSGYRLREALNTYTPDSITIKEAYEAPQDFHSMLSAQEKFYSYLYLNTELQSALRNRYATWERRPLDIGYLNTASQFLLGKQDFASFQTKGTDVPTTVRELLTAHWEPKPGGIIEFKISGKGFLKQMVRNIVGTLTQMQFQKKPPDQIKQVLAALDRQSAGTTAPPQGLYLVKVRYPMDLDSQCRKI